MHSGTTSGAASLLHMVAKFVAYQTFELSFNQALIEGLKFVISSPSPSPSPSASLPILLISRPEGRWWRRPYPRLRPRGTSKLLTPPAAIIRERRRGNRRQRRQFSVIKGLKPQGRRPPGPGAAWNRFGE